MQLLRNILLVSGAALAGLQQAQAQDTLKQETINIISVYQPKLREAAKLNLNASLPTADTSRPRLNYQVPALNLYFMYQPVPLKPLALGKDSLKALQNNYVKFGYGNLSTPLVEAGFGSGRNDKWNFGLFGSYTGSKGEIKNQDYTAVNVLASGTYYSPLFEINGSLKYSLNQVHYYGYDHSVFDFKKSDIKQSFNEVVAQLGLKNRPQDDWGWQFQPDAKFIVFGDSFERMENTFILKAPIRKQLFEDLYLKAEGVLDLSTFKEDNNAAINNNVMAIHPALELIKPGFMLHAGLNPTWTKKNKFYLLPDIVNESHLIRKKLILSSGWISYIDKNNYRNLANKNPFISGFADSIMNTRIEEKYTGIKGTLGSHFTYNTKFAGVTYHNLPLFVNDSIDGKTFDTRNEEELRAFQFHAEVGYIQEEKFQIRLSGDWWSFNKQETELKAWGMVPFQYNLYGQYTFFKKLHLNADLFALGRSYYLDPKTMAFGRTKAAMDLNVGATFNIGKNFNLWANANNLLNSKYQRWNNYASYGLNVLGGVMIKF
ncbi:hypothetical protein MKQ68_14590 [Chitinophaga horti]|uniref:TonB dependent receptor n=1 Tax=Chitinophaga horti TaxID=2920382 RepID=A0ABY6IVR2_9BACT|nr:hypothetical protein [Chitinophaga horti]UYQ91318.1 hypothetical protein MKQ68_14590 [Chitinophaga horti]